MISYVVDIWEVICCVMGDMEGDILCGEWA